MNLDTIYDDLILSLKMRAKCNFARGIWEGKYKHWKRKAIVQKEISDIACRIYNTPHFKTKGVSLDRPPSIPTRLDFLNIGVIA